MQQLIEHKLQILDWDQVRTLYHAKPLSVKTILLLNLFWTLFNQEDGILQDPEKAFKSNRAQLQKFQSATPLPSNLKNAQKLVLKYLLIDYPLPDQRGTASISDQLFTIAKLLISYYSETQGQQDGDQDYHKIPTKRVNTMKRAIVSQRDLSPDECHSSVNLLSLNRTLSLPNERVTVKFKKMLEPPQRDYDPKNIFAKVPMPAYLKSMHERMMIRMNRVANDKNVVKVNYLIQGTTLHTLKFPIIN